MGKSHNYDDEEDDDIHAKQRDKRRGNERKMKVTNRNIFLIRDLSWGDKKKGKKNAGQHDH